MRYVLSLFTLLAACRRTAPASEVAAPRVITRADVVATPQPGATSRVAAPAPPPAPSAMTPAQRFERAVPPFDEATLAHVRAVFAAGTRVGNRPDVFAKLGDSITESGSFLQDFGHGWYDIGAWGRLERVIRHFRRRSFSNDPEDNSFTRGSRAATAGWTTSALLDQGDRCAIEQELTATRPAFALLMIGTNDAERSSVEVYERELREIIRRVEARSVVLALSTIPEQRSSDDARRLGAALNEVIRRVALELHLPLVDYHGALEGLPNDGLDPDNVHPSIFMAGGTNASAGSLTDEGLRYGYNVRNLTSLLMLERLMQAVGLRE